MKPLLAKQLASMRQAITDLLPDECHILSVTNASDAQGGYTQTWATATYAVPCRLDNVLATETDTAGAIQPYSTWRLTLPYDTTITTAHRVEIGTKTYNVTNVITGHSWRASIRAELELL